MLASTGYRVDDKELNDPFITIPRFTTDHIYFENSAFFSDSLRLMVQELHDAGVLGDQSKDRIKRVRQNEIVARYHGISGRLGRHSDYKKDFETRFDKQNSKVIWQMLKFIAEYSHLDEEGKVQLAMFDMRHVCTDYYPAYCTIVPPHMHVETKSETAAIEGLNSRIRHYLARFHRKTYCYSKAIHMVKATLTIFFTHDWCKYLS